MKPVAPIRRPREEPRARIARPGAIWYATRQQKKFHAYTTDGLSLCGKWVAVDDIPYHHCYRTDELCENERCRICDRKRRGRR